LRRSRGDWRKLKHIEPRQTNWRGADSESSHTSSVAV
jgi:hypothetical protein